MRSHACAQEAHGREERAILGLVVNLVRKADVRAIVRPGDVLVPVESLRAAGLTGFSGKRETIEGKEYVSLSSLAPGIKYQLDLTTVSLKLTAEPDYLAGTAVNLRSLQAPPGTIYPRNPSAFLNYSIFLDNFHSPSTTLESGVSLFGNSLLDNSFFVNPDGSLSRGFSSLRIDDQKDLRSLTLGDTFISPSSVLAGSAQIFGLNFSRNFSLNPYFIRVPQGTVTGEALSPSIVDVYVNGTLIKEERIPPGPFTLLNIPYTYGAGQTQVIVRDAFGNVRQAVSSYYLSSQNLESGVSQYSVSLGPVRGAGNFSLKGFDASGNYLYGLSNELTAGGHFEASTDTIDAGPQLIVSTSFGSIALDAALSHSSGQFRTFTSQPLGFGFTRTTFSTRTESVNGYAAALSYVYFYRYFDVGLNLQLMSANYANLSLLASVDRPEFLAQFFTSFPVGARITLIPELAHNESRDAGTTNTAQLVGELRLSSRLSLAITANHTEQTAAKAKDTLFASLTYLLAPSTLLSGTYHKVSRQSPVRQLTMQKTLPLSIGVGYMFRRTWSKGREDYAVQLQDRSQHSFDELDINSTSTGTNATLNLAGSLVAVGGRLFAGYPLRDAFAVIRTPEVPNVRGSIYNQPAGRTDRYGDLLVPDLFSYYGNELEINDHDIPITYRVDSNRETVAPPFRGGAIITFPVRPIRGVTGKLLVEVKGKTVVPAYGTFTMIAQGKTFSSPVGNDGLFYMDSPPPGRHHAKVDFKLGTCSFMIDIPAGKQTFVKLGTVHCKM
jgi:outer membrane usher protein